MRIPEAPGELAAPAMDRERAIDVVLAKDAIYDVLCRYCHGIDRCDLETLRSAYWPEAYEAHGTFNGNAWEFARHMTENLRTGSLRTTQMIGNAWIQVEDDGRHARGEIYVLACIQAKDESGATVDRTVGGRYLDRYERRGAEWRIIDRAYVLDWNRNGPDTSIWDSGLYAMLKTRGERSPRDPWDQGLPPRRQD
jgi:hypothetical protein